MPAEFNMMSLSDQEFKQFRELIQQRLGIHLTEQKRTLLIGRLQRLVRRNGLHSFAEYYNFLLRDRSGKALREMVDQISTNHTSFFREPEHFEFLRSTVLPEILQRHRHAKDRDLRIWCAGCATGEEAYSLQITLQEHLGIRYKHWDAGLLATDISCAALEQAETGVYPSDSLGKMPAFLRRRYFQPLPDDRCMVRQSVRSEITFRRFNLMNRHFPFRRPFDLIFCRNVMIYFDQATKTDLTRQLAEATADGGYLFIGHSESLDRSTCPYRYVKPAVYRKESV